jgi:mercuric ion transport protein
MFVATNELFAYLRSKKVQKYLNLSYLGSLSALGVASCCVLPMTMMLLGLGGSWLAIFGKIAAASYYVLAVSSALVAVAWLVCFQRGSLKKLKWGLAGSTALTALAWGVVFNEARINDYLIMRM